jgi:cysteine desulfuration protein SufE
MSIDEIIENFSLLDEWDDRYRYLIELGRTLPPLSDRERSDANKVQGCASQVFDPWLSAPARMHMPRSHFRHQVWLKKCKPPR